MNNKQFEQVITRQFNNCKDLLVVKAEEYTPDKDVFEVFNKAASLSGEGGRKAALFSFMLKHLVSISDMCHSNETYSTDRWNEKITDAMNYLLLLKAMIEEDEIFRNDPKWGEKCEKTAYGFEWVPDKPSYTSWYEMAKAVEWDERDTCDKNCEECIYYKDWKIGNTSLKDIEGPYCFFEISDEDIQRAKKAVAKKDCRTCDTAIWSLDADKNKDKPVCFKKARGECDGDARVPGKDIPTKPEEIAREDLQKTLQSAGHCTYEGPFCASPVKCDVCEFWAKD